MSNSHKIELLLFLKKKVEEEYIKVQGKLNDKICKNRHAKSNKESNIKITIN